MVAGREQTPKSRMEHLAVQRLSPHELPGTADLVVEECPVACPELHDQLCLLLLQFLHDGLGPTQAFLQG